MAIERNHFTRQSVSLRFVVLVLVAAIINVVPAIAPPVAAAPSAPTASKVPALPSTLRPTPPVATGDGSHAPPHEAQRQASPVSPRPSFDPDRSVVLADDTTPTQKVFANPDGTRTAEVAPRPVRNRDAAGAWRDIDLSLVAAPDGSLGPKAAAVPVRIAATAGDTVASIDTAAGTIGLRHPQSSPAPAAIDKARATYKGALGGRDLLLDLTTDGLEETVVVPNAKAGPSYLDEFVLPVGITARNAESGVEFVDAAGQVVATFGDGIAFDAATAPGPSAAAVSVRLVPAASSSTTVPKQPGSVVTVEVAVDGEWFSNRARVFPVSIDPLLTVPTHAGVGIDTFGWQAAPTANYGSLSDLYVGLYGSGLTQSFIRFDNLVVTPSPDVRVTESHLMLLGRYASDCSKPVNVQGIDNTLSANTVWNNRPAVEGPVVSTTTLGPGCASLWDNFDTTSLVQRWLDGSAPNNGLRVSATNEADPAAFKRFYSNNTGYPPFLYITYDHLPTASTPMTPASASAVGAPNVTLASTTAGDPDGDPVQYWFRATTEANAETGPKVIDSGWQDTPSYTVPVGALVDGSTYYWHVITWDTVVPGPSGTYTYGPISNFRVDSRMGTAADTVGPVSVDLASGNASVAHSSPAVATVGGPMGLSYSYNSGADAGYGLSGSYFSYVPNASPPSFTGATPVMTRTDPTVNFNWAAGGPAPGLTDNMLVRWSGYFTPPRGGIPYTFYAAHDDGLRISVNNQLILNSWRDQSTNGPDCGPDTCGTITLANTDRVPITIEYYEHSSVGFVTVGVKADIGPNNSSLITALQPAWLTTDPPPLPQGWTFAPSTSYVGTRIGEASATLTDASGAGHRWTANNPGFSPPTGEDGVAGTDAAGAMTVHDGGVTSVFDNAGRLTFTRTANDDARPASVAYGWSGTPSRLRTLTDPVSGRVITIDYGGDTACPTGAPPGADAGAPPSMVCAVTYPDGTKTKLWYVAKQLARIEDPGASVVEFAYSGGLLTKVRDPLAFDAVAMTPLSVPDNDTTRTIIGWDASSKVASVTLAAPTSGAPRPAHTYSRPSASETQVHVAGLTEPAGYARQVIFDAAGRTTSERDALGRATTITWDGDAAAGPVADRPTSVTDPAGRIATSLYAAAGRLTDAYGPAPTSCFGADRRPNGSCAPVSHSSSVYDGTIPGLASVYWAGAGRAGAPGMHQTGVGDPTGALLATWASPPGGLGSPWSARFAGEITLASASNLQLRGAGGAANWGSGILWVDDVKVTSTSQSIPAGPHRIAIDYNPGSAPSIELDSRPAGSGTFAVVSGSALRPRYGLVTRASTDDEGGATPTMVTDTAYGPSTADPAAPDAATGLAARTTVDPGGAGLATRFAYETPGPGKYLRPVSRTLPADNATTYSYYGANETPGSNPCVATTVSQAGLRRFATDADPDGAGPKLAKVSEFAYDAWGRMAASRIGGEAWSCVVRDGRGRATSGTVAGPPSRTVVSNYAVGGNPLVTSIADPAGTVTTTTDLLGRIVTYVDATGHTTTTTYDQPGRLTDTAGPQGAMHVAPDAAGRPVTQSLDGTVVATATYAGAGGELSRVDYANATKLGEVTPIGRDQAGRTEVLTFTQAGGAALVADSVDRSQSGRVRDETIDGADANAAAGDAGANFRYDGAGRLTEARVPGQHLTYGFSATNSCGLATTGRNSNRTSMTTNGGAPTTYCYDSADRLVSSSDATVGTPAYDAHGNTTTLGTQTLGYDPANRHMSTTAGATNVTYARDATDRILSRTENGATTGYGFAGPGDSPAFTTGLLGIVVDRFVGLLGGVTLTKRGSGDTWSYPNVHGDVIATANASGVKQGGTLAYDPYGVALGPVPDNSSGNFDYGWLGQHQRGLEHAPGVTPVVEMGARPYAPSVGRFLEADPVEGGSANDYDYCWGDPVNCKDLNGEYPYPYQWSIYDRYWSNYLQRNLVLREGDWDSGWDHIRHVDHDYGWGGWSYQEILSATVESGDYFEQEHGKYEIYLCVTNGSYTRERTFKVVVNTNSARRYRNRENPWKDDYMVGIITAYWDGPSRKIGW